MNSFAVILIIFLEITFFSGVEKKRLIEIILQGIVLHNRSRIV